MKKCLAILLIMITLLSFVTVSADSTQILRLTLEDAQARALATNVQYNNQDGYISDALDDYEDTEEANDEANERSSRGFLEYFTKPITLDATLQTAVNNVKLSRFEKENIKRNSDYNVKKAFINIEKAKYNLEDAKNNVSVKQTDYNTAKLKLELGYLTENNLKELELAYKNAVISADAALKKLQEEVQTLNRYIGREITDYNIEPVITLTTLDISTIDLDKIREDHISNNKSLYQLSLNADLTKKKYDQTKERYDEFVTRKRVENSRKEMEDAYDDATRDYDNARTTFEDATKDLDISLNSTYNSLKTTMDSISNLFKDIEVAKVTAAHNKLMFDQGLMAKNDYEKSEIQLKTLQNKLNTSIADLNLMYSSLTMYSDPDTETAKK
ncbi:MAG TPA: hypothetical protein VEG39_11830 [Clostridia bacterium]|nr:hypothetical protein [Clostridia bacterium]